MIFFLLVVQTEEERKRHSLENLGHKEDEDEESMEMEYKVKDLICESTNHS